MRATILANFYTALRSLWADTDGVILPYVTVMLVVFVGVSVLALDGGRYMSLQSQLQKGADALAIAGAGGLAWSDDDEHGGDPASALLFAPMLGIAGGTTEIQKNIIGERVLGLPKDPAVDKDVAFKDILVGTQK